MKRLAIAAVGLALVVLASGCLYGRVWDAGRNTSRESAEVTWWDEDTMRYYTKKTNSNGWYIFAWRAGDPMPQPGDVFFQVRDRGCVERREYRFVDYLDHPNARELLDYGERQDFSLSCPEPEGGSPAGPPPAPAPPQPPPPPTPTPELIPLPVPRPTPTPTFVALPLPRAINTPIPPPR